jgi:hypothetical protein
MSASKITTWGRSSGGGADRRASSFWVGEVGCGLQVTVAPGVEETTESALALAAELAALVAERNPEPAADDAADLSVAIESAARTIFARAAVLGGRCSAGAWTPAVADGFEWAVLDLRGAPLVLAHDVYEVARMFAIYEAYGIPEDLDMPIRVPSDADQVAERRYENWCTDYRFAPWGDPRFEPPAPGSNGGRT